MHDNSTNNTRLICKTDGRYLVNLSIAAGALGSGATYLGARLYKNGSTFLGQDQSANIYITSTWYVVLAVNDYLEFKIFQDGSTTGSISSNANSVIGTMILDS
jgi:hypothetical protein